MPSFNSASYENSTYKKMTATLNGAANSPLEAVTYVRTSNGGTPPPNIIFHSAIPTPTVNPENARVSGVSEIRWGRRTNPIVAARRVSQSNGSIKYSFRTAALSKTPVVQAFVLDRRRATVANKVKAAVANMPLDDAIGRQNLKAADGKRGVKIKEVLERSLNMTPQWNGESTTNSVYEFFDRYYSIYPEKELTNLYHYVFITRPDLNIVSISKNNVSLVDQVSNIPIFKSILDTQPWILRNLSKDMTVKHDFMPMLTARIESIQLADYSLTTGSVNQPYTGLTLPYASHGIRSMTGGTFDITFREFGDLSIHKLFEVWLEYIDGVVRNKWQPKTKYKNFHIADYMISVYDIICAPDARSILYWSKYTGAFPTSAAHSTLSFNLHEHSADNKISVPFNYYLFETLKPEILSDFNINAKMTGVTKEAAKDIPDVVSTDIPFLPYGTGYGMVERPFITHNSNGLFELRWVPRTTNTI